MESKTVLMKAGGTELELHMYKRPWEPAAMAVTTESRYQGAEKMHTGCKVRLIWRGEMKAVW